MGSGSSGADIGAGKRPGSALDLLAGPCSAEDWGLQQSSQWAQPDDVAELASCSGSVEPKMEQGHLCQVDSAAEHGAAAHSAVHEE